MKVWIDTEFNEFKGALISIALVDEEGRSFYEVLHCEKPGAWVAEHVMPILGREPISIHLLQWRMSRWLMNYPSIHLVSDWPEDLKHFLDLLITGPGERVDTPHLTMEIRRDLDGVPSEIPHNALADAIAIRLSYLALEAQP